MYVWSGNLIKSSGTQKAAAISETHIRDITWNITGDGVTEEQS